jgi:hypothetical protein
MVLAGVLGVSDATFGAVLVVAWLALLGVTVGRYRRGTLAGPRAALLAAAAGAWLGFGRLQVSTAVRAQSRVSWSDRPLAAFPDSQPALGGRGRVTVPTGEPSGRRSPPPRAS